MAPQQIYLQFGKMIARNADVRKFAKAGIDAVDGIFPLEDFPDDLARSVNAASRSWRENDSAFPASDRVDFLESEILPGEQKGR